ncbi:MAG: four helix bundle protein [Bacteroidota bacterium]
MSLYFDANSFFMIESIVAQKSYRFAVRVVKLHLYICKKEKYVYSMSSQLLRSATSIGANVEEALGGHTRKDFSAKMSIAYKEARETRYWIRILVECGIIETRMAASFMKEIEELARILASIVKSSKEHTG